MKVWRHVLAAAAFAAIGAAPASAAPSPPAAGLHATGTLVVAATIAGAPVDVGGNVAMFRSGSMYRLDVLSLGFPGTDPTASAVAGALLPAGGATLIYNGATGAVSGYATGNRSYYESEPTTPGPPPPRATGDAIHATDPLAALATIVRQLHEVERAAILFTGHSTTNGHATDDLDITLRRHRPGKDVEDYHAQFALAEDLDGFPVRILASSAAPTPQGFGGSLRLDLTSVVSDTPPPGFFAVPPGYTRVTSLGALLQAKPT
jgi:hypothetical protein